MTVSLILTVNNRPADVSKRVAESFKLDGNTPDELVLVLDRPTQEARDGALKAYSSLYGLPFRLVEVAGEPGWRGPAKAWNAGFAAATGDLFYCISSEVVQDAGNVARARKQAAGGNAVVFGACHNSTPTQLVVGAEPGELVSTRMARPLGFIVCMPAARVREIHGFDENFMHGYWYDDDDFFLRLWRTGVDFVFDDAIHGTHLDHERPDLATPAGQAGIQRNAQYMLSKHGTVHPWATLARLEQRTPNVCTWSHV